MLRIKDLVIKDLESDDGIYFTNSEDKTISKIEVNVSLVQPSMTETNTEDKSIKETSIKTTLS